MAWQAFRLVFRLRSPLHVGRGKVGNIQLTRPYVTGRAIWGALTERLTRDGFQGGGPATAGPAYRRMGQKVHEHLAFTYFYPALAGGGGDYRVCWPWAGGEAADGDVDDAAAERAFRARFLGSYAATALEYPRHSAVEGSLHEVEFLSPQTIEADPADSQPVYLLGYLFAAEGAPPGWPDALHRLQIGGERGYGWGRIEPVAQAGGRPGAPSLRPEEKQAFGHDLDLSGERPILTLTAEDHLLAHARAGDGLELAAAVEPLIGRRWDAERDRQRHAGQYLEYDGLAYPPGSRLPGGDGVYRFQIGRYGVWRFLTGKE